MLYTENTEPSHLYRKWCGVSTVASALQRKCWVLWGREVIYPQLYVVLVGPSGARKGTAISSMLSLILEPGLGILLAVDSTSRASLIRDIKDSQTTYIGEDGKTMIHSSLTVVAPELTVFLGYKDMQLLTDLTDWYDSHKNPWVHRTISGSSQEIPGVWVNILGATTPSLLRSALPLEAIGGGFTARLLLIYATRRAKKVISGFETPGERELRTALIHDLHNITCIGGQFRISMSALDYYESWYEGYSEEEECKDERFAGYYNRKPTTLKKLSMILSASRADEKIISLSDIELALRMLQEQESVMYYALIGVGKNQYAEVMMRVMEEIMRQKETTLPHLMHRFMDDLTKFELDNIMKSLETMQFCVCYGNTGKIVFNESFNGGSIK